jgi:hypothetical protein
VEQVPTRLGPRNGPTLQATRCGSCWPSKVSMCFHSPALICGAWAIGVPGASKSGAARTRHQERDTAKYRNPGLPLKSHAHLGMIVRNRYAVQAAPVFTTVACHRGCVKTLAANFPRKGLPIACRFPAICRGRGLKMLDWRQNIAPNSRSHGFSHSLHPFETKRRFAARP